MRWRGQVESDCRRRWLVLAVRIGCFASPTWLCGVASQFSAATSCAGNSDALALASVQIVVRSCETFLDMHISGVAPLKGTAAVWARIRLFFGVYFLSVLMVNWLMGALTCPAMPHQVLGSCEAPGANITLIIVIMLVDLGETKVRGEPGRGSQLQAYLLVFPGTHHNSIMALKFFQYQNLVSRTRK